MRCNHLARSADLIDMCGVQYRCYDFVSRFILQPVELYIRPLRKDLGIKR
jgi:hypothetical protein